MFEINRQFTFLGNEEYEKAEFRILSGRDELGDYHRIDIKLDTEWKENDKVYGEREFKQYIKEWETTEDEWGI